MNVRRRGCIFGIAALLALALMLTACGGNDEDYKYSGDTSDTTASDADAYTGDTQPEDSEADTSDSETDKKVGEGGNGGIDLPIVPF